LVIFEKQKFCQELSSKLNSQILKENRSTTPKGDPFQRRRKRRSTWTSAKDMEATDEQVETGRQNSKAVFIAKQ
jgi:hypothetical protein